MIAQAEKVCLAAGLHWTEARRRTFELLATAAQPLKAYDLIARFSETARTNPPTVYRALDVLMSLGLVHQVKTLNAFVACTSHTQPHRAQFLVCDCCSEAVELPLTDVIDIDAAAAKRGYTVISAMVEMRGLCSACRARAEPRS
jgi:Fur family zinc uptake transcriptional regulator